MNPLQSKEGQAAEEGEEGEEKKPKEHRKKRKGSKKHHRRDADKDGKWHIENILYACLERMTTKQQPNNSQTTAKQQPNNSQTNSQTTAILNNIA
ncbi:MAG: hypothetical protein OXU61_04740 [Gammaproteobacteria bacterium]|nr:hypothetical protein [Gammaproteobacteria bacterium]